MFILWLLIILFISYLLSFFIGMLLDITSENVDTSKNHRVKKIVFVVSALTMFSIWGLIIYSSKPSEPFTEKVAGQLIAAEDSPEFTLCIENFQIDNEALYSVSEVKNICSCVIEKNTNEKKSKIGSYEVHWADCTKLFCRTDSCKILEKHYDEKRDAMVRDLERIMYP